MKTLVSFGEIMLRLSPVGKNRLFQGDSFGYCFGGSEANVAVLCSELGMDSVYVTKLPDNQIGGAAKTELLRYGVEGDFLISNIKEIEDAVDHSGITQR